MKQDIRIQKLPPVWFIRALSAFRNALVRFHRVLFPANVVLYEHFQYFWLLPCIRVAAELDIATLLNEGPKSLEELAVLTKTHEDSLRRVLRALSAEKIFRQRKDKLFVNTPMSRALMEGAGSLRYMVLHHLGPVNWNLFSELSHKVKTGEEVFKKLYGKPIYEYLVENKDESLLFGLSMTDLTKIAIEPVMSVFSFSSFQTVADIGGGEGLLLSAILYKNPGLKGILFDLPEGLRGCREVLEKYSVTDRVEIQEGSFFESAPAGADAYLLKNIIHNWSDDDSLKILSGIRKVMPANGRILVIEMIISEDNKPSFGKLIDIQMMVIMRDGRERTKREFDALFGKAGLRISRIIPTIAPFSILEVVRN